MIGYIHLAVSALCFGFAGYSFARGLVEWVVIDCILGTVQSAWAAQSFKRQK